MVDTVLHARSVEGGVRGQAIEDAVTATEDRSRVGGPCKAEARLEHLVVGIDRLGVEVAKRRGLAVEAGGIWIRRLGHKLHVVAKTGSQGKGIGDLPGVLDETGEVLIPEVVRTDVGDWVVYLLERDPVLATVYAIDILNPIGKGCPWPAIAA